MKKTILSVFFVTILALFLGPLSAMGDDSQFIKGYENAIKKRIAKCHFKAQLKDSKSLFTHYKSLINFRKEDSTLTTGNIEFIKSHSKFLSFYRLTDDETKLVIHNVSADKIATEFKIDQNLTGEVIKSFNCFENIDFSYNNGLIKISLPPYSSIIIK